MKTGVQGIYKYLKILDSGFRRNDEKRYFRAFYEIIIHYYAMKKNPEKRGCLSRLWKLPGEEETCKSCIRRGKVYQARETCPR